MNPVTQFASTLRTFWDKHAREIMIGCVARIESHNTKTMRADVTPLLLVTANGTTGTSFAVIPDIPVGFIYAGGFIIRPKYNKGDLVWITFATHSIEKGLQGQSDKTVGRIFSPENASVAYGLSKKSFVPPSDFDGDGILVCNSNGSTRLMIEDAKICMKTMKVEITADVEIKGKISQTGDFETTGKIETAQDIIWLSKTTPTHGSTHIHGAPGGATSAPTPGS